MKQRIIYFLRNLKARDAFFLLILGIGLVILVVQVGRRQLFQQHAAGGNATIVLTPSTNNPVTVVNGGNFNVAVSLNPNGESLVGSDVALTFNQAVLAVNSIQIPTTFPAGQNLQTYAPTNANGTFNSASVISTANSTGTLSMGAVAFNWAANAVTPAQTLAVPFATINFRALAPGTTNIRIKFTSGSTTDSNLVSIVSGSPADVISDSTATALASNLPVTVSGPITPTVTPTPVSASPTPTRTPTPVPPTVTPTRTPTPVQPTATPTVVPPTVTPTRTPTPAPPTPTSAPATGSLNFMIKFQGINSAKPNKLVRVILRQGSTDTYTFNNVNVTANASGVYSGSVSGINPGNYDVLIKGPVHLQKKMTSSPLGIAASTNNVDWSSTVLIVGDVDNSNSIALGDLTGVISVWNQSNTPVNAQNQKYDLDENGFISLGDLTAIISNWTASVVPGDQ